MKIKEVIAQTGLTDRAIRLYIDNGLVFPECTENHKGRKKFDFSADDIAMLQKIATLRKAGFSIAQIKSIQAGEETAAQAFDEFISQIRSQQEHTEKILTALSDIPSDEVPTIDLIYSRLTSVTEDIPIPKKDQKPTVWERVEKLLFSIPAWVIIAIIGLITGLNDLCVMLEFRYAKLDKENLDPWLFFIFFVIPVIAVLLSCAIIILYKCRIYNKKRKKNRTIVAAVLSVCNIGIMFYVVPYLLTFMFACPFYSITENPDNYLIIDDYVDGFYREQIYSLFPTTMPESAKGAGNYYEGHEYPETTYYYYRYKHFIEADFEIIAQWTLPKDEYIAEKNRIESTLKPAVQFIDGQSKTHIQRGDWTYLYFTASDEGESSGYFFKIFAYNDVTHSVRYIIAYSLEELEPYYRTRYKNEFCCINTPKK